MSSAAPPAAPPSTWASWLRSTFGAFYRRAVQHVSLPMQARGGAGGYEQPPLGPPPLRSRVSGAIGRGLRSQWFTVTSIGVGFICLLLMVPFWNAVRMLHSPIVVHLVGGRLPKTIMVASLLLLVLYFVSMSLFFYFGRKHAQNELEMLMKVNVFITLLGATTLLISLPARSQANSVFSEVMTKCENGHKTHELYVAYQDLSLLRQRPECAGLASVEDCRGYKATYGGELLKTLESRYRCSGWCSPPVRRQNSSSATTGRGPTIAKKPSVIPHFVYPPTLFSLSGSRASCDGLVAQDMRSTLRDVGNQLYWEGVYLILVSIGTCFLKLIGLCTKEHIFLTLPKENGNGSNYGAFPDRGPRRYVAQGVLR